MGTIVYDPRRRAKKKPTTLRGRTKNISQSIYEYFFRRPYLPKSSRVLHVVPKFSAQMKAAGLHFHVVSGWTYYDGYHAPESLLA